MAFLVSLWFITESIIIPDGLFMKWVYLSFYIHPIFLVFGQIFLWLKYLTNCILYPLKITCIFFLSIFKFFKHYYHPSSVISDDDVNSMVLQSLSSQNQVGVSFCVSTPPQPCVIEGCGVCENGVLEDDCVSDCDCDDVVVVDDCEEEKIEEEDDDGEEDEEARCFDEVMSSVDHPVDVYVEDVDSLEDNSSSSVVESEENHGGDHDDDHEEDGVYIKYLERMRWFDVLNSDRTYGLNAILNNQVSTPMEHYLNAENWSKETKKRVIRNIESDFEMVYVGQSCLSWEALLYQYTKAEPLLPLEGVFYGHVVGEFQNFQVLLERFLEDERSLDNTRVWNYVRARLDLKTFLQVPQLSGYVEEGREDKKEEQEEAISVKEVLNAIERCIEAFGEFVRIDNKKKPLWSRLKNSLWAYPPIEDPRDLQLLHYLTKTLQKKDIWLKDLQGKKRCWINKVVKPLEESQRKQMLLAMIDVKLVSRVLQMSTISSSQLKWCQQKLENIIFEDGKVFRTCTISPLMFPPS